MRTTVALMLGILLVACMGCSSNPNAEKENAAIKTADAWLEILDAGNFGESWEAGAGYLKGMMAKNKWEAVVGSIREPLGSNVNRHVSAKGYQTEMPGAPDGEYVIIQYTSQFEKKDKCQETVTVTLDTDGTWRVSGYFIK